MTQSVAAQSLQKISRGLLWFTIFIIPIFFLPFTNEASELPKQYALTVLVLLNIVAWIASLVISRQFEFRRTAFDIPLLVFWAVLLLSSLTSQDRLTSLLGNYDNNTWSFVGISVLILLFFLITQSVRRREDAEFLFRAIIISALVAEVYFILKSLVPALVSWIPLALSNPTSVLSSSFGTFVLTAAILSLAGLIRKRARFGSSEAILAAGLALSLVTLMLIGFKTTWMLVAVGLAIFMVYAVARVDEHRFSLVVGSFVVFVIAILFAFFGVPKALSVRLPLEVSLSHGISWKVVSSSITDNVKTFLLGGGPATFVLDFSKYRPDSFNANFAWNVRFGQPSSTILELFSSLGILGMLSFAVIILLALGTALVTWFRRVSTTGLLGRLSKDDAMSESMPWFWGVVTAWTTLLVFAFLNVFSSATWLLFFTITGLLASLSILILKEHETTIRFSLKTSPQYTLLVSFGFIISCSAILVLGVFLTRFLVAETAYAKGLFGVTRGSPENAVAEFSRAIFYHSQRSTYHVSLAQAYLLQGLKVVQSSQADPQLVTTLVALAVNEAKRATELSPNNVTGWQSLATMYANARVIAPDANTWVIRSLERALELERSNPILYMQLANAQLIAGNIDGAVKNLQKAIQLKPDYIDAYLNLALLEEGRGKIDDALNHLSQALLIQPQNTDVLFNVGRVYFNRNREGDLVRARTAFELALQVNPIFANALYSLGLVHERLGNPATALNLYRRVLDLNPNNNDVKRKIQALAPAPTPVEEKQ